MLRQGKKVWIEKEKRIENPNVISRRPGNWSETWLKTQMVSIFQTWTGPLIKLILHCCVTCIDSYHMLSLSLLLQLECPFSPQLFQILLYFRLTPSMVSMTLPTSSELFLVCICAVLSRFSCVRLFGLYGPWPTRLLCPWEFSRQEYWNGLPYSLPGDLPDPRDQTSISCISCIGRQILYH